LRSAALFLSFLLVPVTATAQLVPGEHSFAPLAGVSFARSDLANATTEIALGFPPVSDSLQALAGLVSASLSLDPGVFTGVRYAYNVNRQLAVEAEFNAGIAVFVIEMQQQRTEEDEGIPGIESTTTDARIYQYFVNLSYYFATWGAANPFFTAGFGSRTMNLRQKGEVNFDNIYDRTYMAGAGLNFNVNSRLRIRFDVRDFMYNFSFDNQLAGHNSDIIHCPVINANGEAACRDVELATSASGTKFQNDIVVSLGFLMRAF
jgi:opacity protein-like surface antigen